MTKRTLENIPDEIDILGPDDELVHTWKLNRHAKTVVLNIALREHRSLEKAAELFVNRAVREGIRRWKRTRKLTGSSAPSSLLRGTQKIT